MTDRAPLPHTRPRLAWLVIVVCVALFAWRAHASKAAAAEGEGSGVKSGQALVELQGRFLLARKSPGAVQPVPTTTEQLDDIDGPPTSRRHRVAVLAAALMGPAAARDRLAELDPESMDDADRRVHGLLTDLFAEPDDAWPARATDVSDDDVAYLRRRLGWIGLVATSPKGVGSAARRAELEADLGRTGTGLVVGITGALGLGLVGLAALLVLVILAATGRLATAFRPSATHAGVLTETFAVYLAIMASGQVLHAVVDDPPPWVAIAGLTASGLAVLWPRARGMSWRETRSMLGLTRGTGVIREGASGGLGYVAGLPVLACGIVGTLLLIFAAKEFGVPADGSHPAAAGLAGSSALRLVATLLLASVLAPLLEETFFRGALYPALRAATGGRGTRVSVALSAAASSLIFAAVHPQSWVAVPALASLGIVFALAREWRGSLIAPMTIHALSNAIVITGLWFLTS